MDEREVANHVFEIVDREAYRAAAQRVLAVSVAIGGEYPLNPEQLQQSFGTITRGTVAEGARLLVDVLPVKRHCRNCGADFESREPDPPCPTCSHPKTEPTSGHEVKVLNIQVEGQA